MILAWAGLHRLGLKRHVTERLEPPRFLPAVGQGALGIECRGDDATLRELLRPLDDPATHRAVLAERRALAELEGGCMIPMAAWARDVEDEGEQGRAGRWPSTPRCSTPTAAPMSPPRCTARATTPKGSASASREALRARGAEGCWAGPGSSGMRPGSFGLTGREGQGRFSCRWP